MQRTFGATQVVTTGADTVKTVLAIIIVVVAVVKAGSVLAFFFNSKVTFLHMVILFGLCGPSKTYVYVNLCEGMPYKYERVRQRHFFLGGYS